MANPVLYGPKISTYVRSARLTLSEKDVDYDLEEVDIFAGAHKAPAYLARQPFGKVPALEHEGFVLYETCAIQRYIDEAFRGPRLQPGEPRGRARMTQAISLIDCYAYRPIVQGIVIPRFVAMREGSTPDEAGLEAALPGARQAIEALEALLAGEFIAGKELSLADLHLVPIYDYFRQTPEGESLLSAAPKLGRWWATVSRRESVEATAPSLG